MNTITERKFHCLLLLLLFALLMMVVCSISLGRYYISPVHVVKIILAPLYPMVQDWSNQASSVIYTLRLPRALAAMMIGAALSLSGASYQSVFKNPLVAPDMLGVSSGACVGASLCILLGFSQAGVQGGAFVGGLLAVFLAVSIPRIIGKNSIVMLVLSGIIVSGLTGSLLGIIKYLADSDTQLPAITYWQLGSLVSVVWTNLLSSGVPILLCMIFMMLIRWRMNILTIRRRKSYVRETQRIPPVCSDSLRHHSDSLLRLYQRDHWLGRIGHSSLFSHDGRTG